MRIKNIHKTLFAIAILSGFMSCQRTVLKIDEVPSNTPPGSQIYVAGNFNLWDSGDDNFRMNFDEKDSSYSIRLPLVMGMVEYKFTRGNWSTVEADRCGNEINNRFFDRARMDTIFHVIDSWQDLDPVNCDSVTIIVERIPEKTPKNDTLKIAGSFNAWNPGDRSEYFLRLDSIKNQYVVTVPRIAYNGKNNKLLTYKFVRDDITVSETDEFGREISPRVLDFEKGDTVKVEIKNWTDIIEVPDTTVTIILNSIPINTPTIDDIYLVGNFNNWNPKDNKYVFKRNENGLLEIQLPRQRYGLSFKITRGGWEKEFADACGYKMSNQDYNYDEIDTLLINVEAWLDIKRPNSDSVVLIVNQLPENTPEDAELRIMNQELSQFFNFKSYDLIKNELGHYQVKIKKKELNYNFIFTRGNYISQEVTEKGEFIWPRNIYNNCADTLYFQIANWNDLIEDNNFAKIIIKKLPNKSPVDDDIYIVGRFNGWNPGDNRFKLKLNSKQEFEIDIPKRYLRKGYKFTRGSWETVEGNLLGTYRDNRYYKGNKDLIEVEIKSWEDKRGLFNSGGRRKIK